jgi:oligosaccharide translocation protein RFT1
VSKMLHVRYGVIFSIPSSAAASRLSFIPFLKRLEYSIPIMASSQLPQKSDAKNLLSASAEGVKFLVLLQVSSRFLTFLVNQLLLRYLSPALLGISVQLELFTVTILYFSRESIRNALQRHVSVLNDSQKISLTLATKGLRPGEGIVAADTQSIVNISILTVPLGVLFSVFFGYIYAGGLASTESTQQPYFGLSIGLYILATLLELISEPGFAISQHRMLYKLRTGAESAAALVRCILTCGITVWAARGGLIMGPLPFAIGQIGYGAVLMTVYGVKTWRLAVNEGFKMGLITIEEGCETSGVIHLYKCLLTVNLQKGRISILLGLF